jgi:ABC-type phosphate transport system substrate-binding protein
MVRTNATIFRCIAALVLAGSGLGATSSARSPQYRIIVHPQNSVTGIDREFLRSAYLKKQIAWQQGEPLRPVGLPRTFAVQEQFTREVLQKTPAQLRNYWNQQIFSGKGVPPIEAATTAEVIAYVIANPGAIGYLPADVDPGAAKSIEVK